MTDAKVASKLCKAITERAAHDSTPESAQYITVCLRACTEADQTYSAMCTARVLPSPVCAVARAASVRFCNGRCITQPPPALPGGPTQKLTSYPTKQPTPSPTQTFTAAPTPMPSLDPTSFPTREPTLAPTQLVTNPPTTMPTFAPSMPLTPAVPQACQP